MTWLTLILRILASLVPFVTGQVARRQGQKADPEYQHQKRKEATREEIIEPDQVKAGELANAHLDSDMERLRYLKARGATRRSDSD